MSTNPWLVKNFRDYWYLNCPECTFKTKEVYNFKEHAVKNHPLSCVVFRSFIASDSKTNPVCSTVITETVKEETNEDQITDPLATLPKHPLSCAVFRSFIPSNSKTNPVSATVNTKIIKEEIDEDHATLPKKEKILEESYEQNGINENQIAVVKNENYSVEVSMPVNTKRKAAEKPVIIPNKKP